MSANAEQVRAGLARAKDGLSVFRGTRLLGFVITRRDGFDALTASGAALGRFTSERAAAIALLEADPAR